MERVTSRSILSDRSAPHFTSSEVLCVYVYMCVSLIASLSLCVSVCLSVCVLCVSSNKAERSKGLDVINKIRNDDRGGRALITLLSDEPQHEVFWSTLGGAWCSSNPVP